jgi:hypothetical protein
VLSIIRGNGLQTFASDLLKIPVLPFLAGKSLNTKDTKYTKEKTRDFLGFSFVTVVSFVFKKSCLVKNDRAKIS